MSNIYLDVETCGLYGMPVLIQYAIEDGEIELYEPWHEPIWKTMELIDMLCENTIIGFNIVFDWFHICKLYTTFALCDPNWIPVDHIDEIAVLEEKARMGDCVKPFAALDLMLHARKGPYQSIMAREDIKIKRIPIQMVEELRAEVEKRVQIDGIYFARRKNKLAPQWGIYDCQDKHGNYEPRFKNLVLKFFASGTLKVLAEHLGITSKAMRFGDVEVDKVWRPKEYGFAPFALAVGKPGNWKGAWPEVIQKHIDHWRYHKMAREYARDDITYTRGLHKHQVFKDAVAGDDDSTLACMVAAVRWRGFKVKVESMQAMKQAARKRYEGIPMHPAGAKFFIQEVMSNAEKASMGNSTKKVVLEKISKSECDCVLENEDSRKCTLCNGSKLHPSAQRAKVIINARAAKKEEEIYDKIILPRRFHASFVVIGTLSSRMAGADSLNPQGIKHTDEVRDCFSLADDGFVLCGGDFDSFEVVLADAAYNDPNLRADLKADKKIHALFGMEMFQCSYEEVMKSKSTENDMYTKGKQGVFALIYGGDENTLVKKQGIDEEIAKIACEGFIKKYPQIGVARKKVFDSFCSMRQDPVTSKVSWSEPADYIESLLGFRRYFTLENRICKALFDLAEKPPEAFKKFNMKVIRNPMKGVQTAHGAVRSALYGAAFGIQAAAMRAAANHVIQSTGATITKRVQRRIWDIQPHGINSWRLMPLNVHDELMVPTRPQYIELVKQTVHDTVESYREQVPLIKMEWDTNLESWSKGFTESKVKKIKTLAKEGKEYDEICTVLKFKSDEAKGKCKSVLDGESWQWIQAA